uniref:Uncharacterized protein n=1 Tax=Rhizophora mucronata TaxID=61149 RepID=A0A2P2N4D0_RHIMU
MTSDFRVNLGAIRIYGNNQD